jgi:drug/metabolite transporter (DMT)-like permease
VNAQALIEPPLAPRLQMRVLIPFIIVTLIWSSTWLVIRGQLGTVPGAWSIAYRFGLSSLTLFAFVAVRRESLALPRGAFPVVAMIALTQFVLNYVWVYAAEEYVTSGLVAVLFALLIVPNALLAWLLLGQGVSRPFLFGSAVALAGLSLMLAHEIEAAPVGGHAILLGIGYSLLGVLVTSIANVTQAMPQANALPKATLLAYAMGLGALMDGALAWMTSGAPVFDTGPAYIGGLLYLGVIGSSLPFVLYLQVIRSIGPARAAYSSVLIPILAMTLSTIFEHYVWSWEAALGGILTLAGLLVALRARSPAR